MAPLFSYCPPLSPWLSGTSTSGLGSGPGSRHPSINIGAPSRSGTGPQVKSDSTPEPQVRSAGSLCAEPAATDKEPTEEDVQASDNSSDSQTEETQLQPQPQAQPQQQPQPQPQPQQQPPRRPSSPSKPVGSPSRATNGQSPSPVSPGSASASRGQLATGSVSGSQIPSKARPHRSRGSLTSRAAQRARLPSATLGSAQLPMRSGGTSQPTGRSLGPNRTTARHTAANQQTPQVSAAGRSAAAAAAAAAAPAAAVPASAAPASAAPAATTAPTSTQRVSVSAQGSPRAQSPSTPPDLNQAGSKTPVVLPADAGCKNNKQKTQVAGSTSASELLAPCHSDSSLEYLSESTTEITCKWPDYSHQLRCPRHCWLLPHLAY